MTFGTDSGRRARWAWLLLLSVLLVACSAPEGAPPTALSSRTVTDVTGAEVQVPADPQRVVPLSEPTLDAVLALGVTPIGTVTGRGQASVPNYLFDRAGAVPILGSIGQPNFEAIGAAKPDLILVDGTSVNNNPPVLEALRQIAPVVFTGYAGGEWRTNFRNVAAALGKPDQGEQLIAAYDTKVVEAKAALQPVADRTFSIVRWQGTAPALILKELPAGQALVELGLKRPPAQDTFGRGHSEPVSLENLQQIDADYMFFGTLGGSSVSNPNAGGSAGLDGARRSLEAAEQVPGFTQLNAYRGDRIILVDGSAWTSTGGPLLMNRLVDDVRKTLG